MTLPSRTRKPTPLLLLLQQEMTKGCYMRLFGTVSSP